MVWVGGISGAIPVTCLGVLKYTFSPLLEHHGQRRYKCTSKARFKMIYFGAFGIFETNARTVRAHEIHARGHVSVFVPGVPRGGRQNRAHWLRV
jgi:hypothetical protein